MTKFVVAPGFIVAGKTEGQEVKASDIATKFCKELASKGYITFDGKVAKLIT